MQKIQREPVALSGLIVAVLELFIMMALSLGWINWDSNQVASVNNFIIALVALLAAGVPLVGAYMARNRVTPLVRPRDKNGAKLVAQDNK